MAKKKKGVMYQPRLSEGMRRGINQFVNAVRPTLGPFGRTVLNASLSKHAQVLDNGKDIAKRITALRGDAENAGAMLVREVMQRQHEAVGDGSSTAAVLFQKVYALGYQYIASGGDAQQLRYYLIKYSPVVTEELERLSQPLQSKDQLVGFATSHAQDEALAIALGEIFDVIGPFGRLDVRTHYQNELRHEFVSGNYWASEPFSKEMLWSNRTSATLVNPAVFLSDLELNTASDLLPIFEAARARGNPSLLIVAKLFSKEVTTAMYSLMQASDLRCVAVKLPGTTLAEQITTLEDLSVLTGAGAYHKAAGSLTKNLQAHELGRVRRAVVKVNHFLLTGFGGDVATKKQHLAKLKDKFLKADDPKTRNALQERVATFKGGSATLWLPDHTKSETEFRKSVVQRLASGLRHAMLTGVVPGGGAALFASSYVLENKLQAVTDPDERAALHILIRAVQEPARAILENSGCDLTPALAALAKSQQGYGYDARKGQGVKMVEAGILDGFEVQKMALQGAVQTAALALTVAAFVH
jgi:chaperonin GroEL